jgi:hypothetical protein
MKLGAASRHIMGGMVGSLRALVKSACGSTASVARALGKGIYRPMKRNRRGDKYVLQTGHFNSRSRS